MSRARNGNDGPRAAPVGNLHRRLVAVNVAGGAALVALAALPTRSSDLTPPPSALAVVLGYSVAALIVAVEATVRRVRRTGRVLADLGPTDDRSRDLVFGFPWAVAATYAWCWLGGGVLIATLTQLSGGTTAASALSLLAALLGGAATFSITFLIAERHLRPHLMAVLADDATAPPALFTIRHRTALVWALGSGIPLIGIAVTALSAGATDNSTFRAAILILCLAAAISGLLAVLTFAASLAGPIEQLTHAINTVRAGDYTTSVDVDSAGEIGALERGFNHMVSGLRERERIRDTFGQYVGTDVAALALSTTESHTPQLHDVTVLFVDVIGSTALAETVPPTELLERLNAMFTCVVRAAADEGGWVDKFVGDGALCVFGAPNQLDDHATKALNAAHKLRTSLNDSAQGPSLDVGIGLATGAVVAGNLGAHDRHDYTVLGDPVHVASRLCDLAKTHQGRTLASATTIAAAAKNEPNLWRAIGPVELRGRSAHVEAYEHRAAALPSPTLRTT